MPENTAYCPLDLHSLLIRPIGLAKYGSFGLLCSFFSGRWEIGAEILDLL